MSSECEREFSSADNVITDDWNCLADETIEALELQKSQLNKGHIGKDEDEQGVQGGLIFGVYIYYIR